MPQQESKSIPEVVAELRELLVSYARQEIVAPAKNLGRFVGFGVAGSVFLAFGGVLLTLSVLRVLQTETGTRFTGNLSWLPYLIAFVLDVLVAVLLVFRIRAKPKEDR